MSAETDSPKTLSASASGADEEPVSLGGRIGIMLFLFPALLIGTVGLGKFIAVFMR